MLDRVGGQSAAARLLGKPVISVQYWVKHGRIRKSALDSIHAAIESSGGSLAKHLPWPREEDGTPLGIDVGEHYATVLGVVNGMRAPRHVEPEEFTSEVFYRLLRRNHVRSAYDPRRGPLVPHVALVAMGTRAYLRKTARRYYATTEPFSERIESLLYGG